MHNCDFLAEPDFLIDDQIDLKFRNVAEFQNPYKLYKEGEIDGSGDH